MSFAIADRVKETSTTTGTGTLNLAGAATNFQTFVAGIGTGNKTFYAIVHQTLAEWEVGIGTITDATPDTLSRDVIIAGTNGTSAVNFSAGTKDVFCDAPASLLQTFLLSIATAVNSANYTIPIPVPSYITLPDLTGQANRNVVLPSAPPTQMLIIKNKNVDDNGFYWTFTNGTVKDFAENTVTQLLNTIVYQLVFDGTNWNIIN